MLSIPADPSPVFYVAQGLGAVGFVLIFLAPLVRRRARFLALDLAGLVPVSVHYGLLGAPVGAALAALYILMDVVAAGFSRHPVARRAYWLFYPAGALVTWLFFVDARDLAALAGTLLAVASRQQDDFAMLKFLIFLSTVGWGAYGYLVGSYSQVLFSVAYAASSLLGTADELRRRPPPP